MYKYLRTNNEAKPSDLSNENKDIYVFFDLPVIDK